MRFDSAHWQHRLDTLRAAHHVPGASLAVLVDGEIHELASGVLHRGTGVAATTDSLFLSGSLAKVYTATVVLQLVDQGLLDLDTRVADVLPEFGTPDPAATRTITIRQLLSHTSGLTCDFTYDSGRGDDCLARYVRAAAEVALDCPPGTALSYSSVGYAVLGRVIEVVTGGTWDQAVRDMLFTPLGLTHSVTLPEQALRFRVAMSHLGGPGQDPEPAPAWDLMPRSAGPYGRVITSAGDVARLARMHLDGGVAPDGTRLLSEQAVAAMRRRVVDSPDKWTVSADGWGLGWTLYDWAGVPGFGHDGSAVAQHSFLRVVPHAGVAVVLLTNGGGVNGLYHDLFSELLGELAGVRMPAPFGPPASPPAVDVTPLLGTYLREGVVTTVFRGEDGGTRVRYEFVDGMRDFSPPLEADLIPVSDAVFAACGGSFGPQAVPVVFASLSNGTPCVYIGMRATPKTA
ncbi:serine hydrolase domain-containing protein [Goodfellowiella coeruleoviolacea]|uniref:CubicO group peptidase, beta-lactamase class C family n=1 Tax=Goodfellowiella coeruleoviolacea TaxID=334858 RepID=A0AAE3KHV5_9PSEU|nr:serine hydrolase domain-containing protein [Goodfellowiella coeruleoviolacea]MCP2166819.1 CubicO group peptidase, beta-lactamase class C family [Goodfellowiella coeruleoviolacea]